MKSSLLFLLLSSILFISCEKDFPGLIDSTVEQYQVISVSPSGNVVYNAIDSLITLRINFTQSSEVGIVVCDLYSPDNKKLNSSSMLLYDNGNPEFGDDIANDNKFANKFPLSTLDPVGTYSVRFYIQGQYGSYNLIAQTSFDYDNGQDNVAPVISDLVMVDSASSTPIDSIEVDVSFIFSVYVVDQNGYNDIDLVFFELFRPDNTVVTDGSGNSRIQMPDNGNIQVYGDQTAGDGIFSFKNKFLDSPTTQRGNWRFEFQALDRGGLLSNKITKTLKVL
jgi:hypothetical protein